VHWFFDAAITPQSVNLAAEELRHLGSLRIRNGEEIVVTNGVGAAHVFTLQDAKQGSIVFRESLVAGRRKPSIHLVQALAKGDRDEMAVQASVELGVESITPWQAQRSIANWQGKEEKGRSRWEQIAISAMKQSQQSTLAPVLPLVQTSELNPRGLGLVLSPTADNGLGQLLDGQAEITLVVGPEGGISSEEIGQLVGQGFVPCKLGPSVLRTSTAGPAAIAGIQALSGAWEAQ